MANYSNPLFDFAYSSERSIEDGIQELSDAEMGTVIISYVVMFVYITMALGKFKGLKNLLVGKEIPFLPHAPFTDFLFLPPTHRWRAKLSWP